MHHNQIRSVWRGGRRTVLAGGWCQNTLTSWSKSPLGQHASPWVLPAATPCTMLCKLHAACRHPPTRPPPPCRLPCTLFFLQTLLLATLHCGGRPQGYHRALRGLSVVCSFLIFRLNKCNCDPTHGTQSHGKTSLVLRYCVK